MMFQFLHYVPSCFTAWCRPFVLFANKKDIRLTEISQESRNALSRTTIVVKFLEDAAALDFVLSENKVWGLLQKIGRLRNVPKIGRFAKIGRFQQNYV